MAEKNGTWRMDHHTVQARLAPALVVALPIALVTAVVLGAVVWTAVWGLVAWAGGTALLAQLGRDGGKRREPGLFASWGGKPTIARLRHRGVTNPVTLARWHGKLARTRAMAQALPTAQQEASDPDAADIVYEAYGAFLRDRTRDQNHFALIAAENRNYGFRRNLWGMKPVGITIAVGALIVVGIVLAVHPSARHGLVVAAALVDLMLLLGWIFVFTPAWVRVAAEAYAERLLEACEKL
jgi:hypothetical protein